jgi:hypothetical protein
LESGDDFTRALLGSVGSELPEPCGLRDAALALGLAVPAANALAAAVPLGSATAASVPAAAGTVTGGAAGGSVTSAAGVGGALGATTLGAVGKSLLGGALVSFLALTTLDHTLSTSAKGVQPSQPASSRLASNDAQPSVAQPSPLAAPAAASEPEGAVPLAVRAATSRSAAPRSAEPAPAPAAHAAGVAPASAAFEAEAQPEPSRAVAKASLAATIALLDQTRAALAAGNTERASRLLDAYAASQHGPALAQEAAQLRVKLLLGQGRKAEAVQLARQILAQHPESAHVDSLRRLAAEP